MRRGRVWLALGVGTMLLLSLVWIALTRPDEVEQLMRSQGPVATGYHEARPGIGPSDMIESWVVLPAQDVDTNPLYVELRRRGWTSLSDFRRKWGRTVSLALPPGAHATFTSNGELRIQYVRVASTGQRISHWIKKVLRIEGKPPGYL
jgi:hypothetical protein